MSQGWNLTLTYKGVQTVELCFLYLSSASLQPCFLLMVGNGKHLASANERPLSIFYFITASLGWIFTWFKVQTSCKSCFHPVKFFPFCLPRWEAWMSSGQWGSGPIRLVSVSRVAYLESLPLAWWRSPSALAGWASSPVFCIRPTLWSMVRVLFNPWAFALGICSRSYFILQ